MSKQTVWLITMLSLMVVLSAYYIVTGPVTPADTNVEDDGEEVITKEMNPLDLALFGPDEDDDDAKAKSDEEEKDEQQSNDTEGDKADNNEAVMQGGDFFLSTKTERSAVDSQLISKYTDIVTDPNSDEAARKEASAKLAEIKESIERINLIEDLITEQGFNDALVVEKDGKYDITVQADSLTKKQVLQILEVVQSETDTPATHLTVSYRP